MAETLHDAVFWLPSQFLNDDDFLIDKPAAPNNNSNSTTTTEANQNPCAAGLKPLLSFPSEFPYEFDSPDSPETGNASDEDDFLAGLTRRMTHSSTQKLDKSWIESGSPESTLSGIKSWSVSSNGSPDGSSPPTTPFSGKNDTWDLIYEAADQVARMKIGTNGDRLSAVNNNRHGRGLFGSANGSIPMHVLRNPDLGLYSRQRVNYNSMDSNLYTNQDVQLCESAALKERQQLRQAILALQHQQQQHQIHKKSRNFCYESPRCVPFNGGAQPAWRQQPQHTTNPGMRAAYLGVPGGGGGGVKRESTGTGVFLPRRYGNHNHNNNHSNYPPRKKSGCSTVLLPPKVVQALNLNVDDAIVHAPARYHTGFGPNYDAIMARRNNAVLAIQRGSIIRPDGGLSHELHLPQDWTY